MAHGYKFTIQTNVLAMLLACSGALTYSLSFLQYILSRDSKGCQGLEAENL